MSQNTTAPNKTKKWTQNSPKEVKTKVDKVGRRTLTIKQTITKTKMMILQESWTKTIHPIIMKNNWENKKMN